MRFPSWKALFWPHIYGNLLAVDLQVCTIQIKNRIINKTTKSLLYFFTDHKGRVFELLLGSQCLDRPRCILWFDDEKRIQIERLISTQNYLQALSVFARYIPWAHRQRHIKITYQNWSWLNLHEVAGLLFFEVLIWKYLCYFQGFFESWFIFISI